jgi:hypothetical protein
MTLNKIFKYLKFNKKNYGKYILYLVFLYFVSAAVGLTGIFYLYDHLKEKYAKREYGIIHNQENVDIEKENRIFSLEYFLFPKKNNISYKVKFTKKENYDIYDNYNISKFSNNLLTNSKNSRAKSSGYFDIYNDEKIIFAGGDGVFGYFDVNNFTKESFNMNLIRSNLKSIVNYQEFFSKGSLGVKDITVDNNEIYISYNKEVRKNCYNVSILKAKIDFSFLLFEEFFTYDECWEDTGIARNRSGGRISVKNDKKIIFSIGAYDIWTSPQDSKSMFGSIIEIDKKTKKFKVLSKGHRNPQGLYYVKKHNVIISTDHGSKRGDEVNVDIEPGIKIKNFGWPISSYGDHYDEDKDAIKDLYSIAPLHKSHKDYGFEEPAKYYKKNVAPSGITFVPEKFSKIKKSFFISGLGFSQPDGAKALYIVGFNDDFSKIIEEDMISIGERIRDLQFLESQNTLILFLESTSSFALIKAIEES